MPDRCPHHDALIEGQATIATELVHIKEEIQEFKVILRGSNGISGMVGWFQQRKGEMRTSARVNGAIGGIAMVVIATIIRVVIYGWGK